MTSCIYAIKNAVTGKFYIGRTINSKARFSSHLCALRRGNHANLHLQSSYAAHGESALSFDILWEERADRLEELEQFLLEELFPTRKLYNISKSAHGGDDRAACPDARAKAVATRRANGHKPFSEETRQKKKDDASRHSTRNPTCPPTSESATTKSSIPVPRCPTKIGPKKYPRPRSTYSATP